MKRNEIIEHLAWTQNGKVVNAVCFIVEDNADSLTFALTKSFDGYVDIQTIKKHAVVSRNSVEVKACEL
jgi:hypothetical protein